MRSQVRRGKSGRTAPAAHGQGRPWAGEGRQGRDQHIEERDEGADGRAWSRRCPGRMTQRPLAERGPERKWRGGTVFRPRPSPRNSSPVRRAAQTWISQSHRPARTLPNTPPHAQHADEEHGLELLQKVRSRLPPCRVRSPEAYSLPLCGCRWDSLPPAPAVARDPAQPGKRNRDAIRPAISGASHCPKPSRTSRPVTTMKGNRAGITVPAQRVRGLDCLESRSCLASARNRTKHPAQDQAHIQSVSAASYASPAIPYAGGGGSYGGTGKPGEFPHRVR